jgi:hypothetical protein
MLLGRILQTPLTSNRFLQIETTDLPSAQLTSTALNELRTQFIRPMPPPAAVGDDDQFERGDLDDDNMSCGVSRVESMSSGDEDEIRNGIQLDFDAGGLRHSGYEYHGGSEYGGSVDSDIVDDAATERVFNQAARAENLPAASSPPIEDGDQEGYPQEFYCPILHKVMRDPVICEDGHTYEREAILQWFQLNQTSPLTNNPLSSTKLIPNHALRNVIATAREERKGIKTTPSSHSPKEKSKKDGCRIM